MKPKIKLLPWPAPGLAIVAALTLGCGGLNSSPPEDQVQVKDEDEGVDRCADAMITAQVKSLIMANEGLTAFDINVETEKCVVTLEGCVDTEAQRRRCGEVASKAAGVHEVNNDLGLCDRP